MFDTEAGSFQIAELVEMWNVTWSMDTGGGWREAMAVRSFLHPLQLFEKWEKKQSQAAEDEKWHFLHWVP